MLRVTAALILVVSIAVFVSAQTDTESPTTAITTDAPTTSSEPTTAVTTVSTTQFAITTTAPTSTVPPTTNEAAATTETDGTSTSNATSGGGNNSTTEAPSMTTEAPLTTAQEVVVVTNSSNNATNEATVPVETAATPVPTIVAAPVVSFSSQVTLMINFSFDSFRDADFAVRVAAMVKVDVASVKIIRKRALNNATSTGNGTLVDFCFVRPSHADAQARCKEFRDRCRQDTQFNAVFPVASVDVDVSLSLSTASSSTHIRVTIDIHVSAFDEFDFAVRVSATVGLTVDSVQIYSKIVDSKGRIVVQFGFLSSSTAIADSKCDKFINTATTNSTFNASYPVAAIAAVTAAPVVTSSPTVANTTRAPQQHGGRLTIRITVVLNISMSAFDDGEFRVRAGAVVGVSADVIVILSKRASNGVTVTFTFNLDDNDELMRKTDDFERRALSDTNLNAAYPVLSVNGDSGSFDSATRCSVAATVLAALLLMVMC